jgi:hypothetical protein
VAAPVQELKEDIVKIGKVFIFSNGNMAVFDEKDQQVSELQKPWMEMIFEFLESRGVDPRNVQEIQFFGGSDVMINPIKIPDGWNWSVK